MILEGLHEKGIFTEQYPFRLAISTEENFAYPLHWHNAVELVYVLEDECKVTVNTQEYRLFKQDIFLIAGGDVHGFSCCRQKGRRAFIQFDVSMLDGFQKLNAAKPYISSSRFISCRTDQALHHLLEQQIIRILQEYDHKEMLYPMALNARIFDIIVLLSRSFSQNRDIIHHKQATNKGRGMEKLDKAFQYIEDHYQEDISLMQVAKSAGFSEYHFSRIFKDITEKNFHTYLNEFRIKKSEKLLMDNHLSVIQAAHSVGFNSIATFNRVFKEIKGCTPAQYRKISV